MTKWRCNGTNASDTGNPNWGHTGFLGQKDRILLYSIDFSGMIFIMAGTLRDIRNWKLRLEAAGLRGITKQQILDIPGRSQSQAGWITKACGLMHSRLPQQAGTGWTFSTLPDQRRASLTGLMMSPTPAHGSRYSAAAGNYTCDFVLRFTAATAGKYDFRITHATDAVTPGVYVGEFSPYQDSVTLTAGQMAHVAISSALLKDVARMRRIQWSTKARTIQLSPCTSASSAYNGNNQAER